MNKILITGCNGQLGTELGKLLPNAIKTDYQQLDITNADAVKQFVSKNQIDTIINCAAYTAVDKAEDDIALSEKININGPWNLAMTGAKIIHISTDYVFDGKADRPYIEFDEVNPQGAYGKTKLAGENMVREFADKYYIVRTAWLYGDGKNFVKTMLRLSETNDTVRVVADQFGTPTSADELAKAICYLIPTDNYGIFHGTCEGSCSWADFTEEIFRIKGLSTKVDHITTAEYPTPAKRPAYSVLENYMLKLTGDYMFADWKEAIKEYLD